MTDRKIDPIKKLYTFEVRGTGAFPIDMLRYDMCWPDRESPDSAQLQAQSHRPRGSGAWSVVLTGAKPPTEGRWNSFGWKIVS